jgi:hypothetical protein
MRVDEAVLNGAYVNIFVSKAVQQIANLVRLTWPGCCYCIIWSDLPMRWMLQMPVARKDVLNSGTFQMMMVLKTHTYYLHQSNTEMKNKKPLGS